MYSRVFACDEEEEFYKLEDQRLPDIDLRDRQRVVIRLFAHREGRDQIGMEYGAIVYRNPHNGMLCAQIELESTGERKFMPLNIRNDGVLMSQALPPHERRLVHAGVRFYVYPAHDGQPSRPFGYILSEEYAARSITDSPEVLRLVAA